MKERPMLGGVVIGVFACFAFPNQRFIITLSSTLSSSLAVESKENPDEGLMHSLNQLAQ